MLHDMQPQRRQILDLAAFTQQDRRGRQCRLTDMTGRWSMDDDLIGRCHQPQRLTGMADLPTRFLAAALAQTLRLTR